MRPHISYSELVAFATDCQWRWKLDYLEGHRSEKFSVHFDFGTAVHEALELHLTRKEPISVDEAVHVFRTKFQELASENGSRYREPLTSKELDEFLASGENILRHLDKCDELASAQVVHNEYPLFEPIDRDDGADIKFKGFIDLVIKTKSKRGKTILYICDFKTCSWGWDGDTRQDRWKHYQIFLYKYFLCKRFNIDPKEVRTAFVLLKRRPPKGTPPVEFFPVSAGPVSVQRALDTLGSNITEMIQRERDGSFKKDRKLCISKYGDKCPYLDTPLCPKDA